MLHCMISVRQNTQKPKLRPADLWQQGRSLPIFADLTQGLVSPDPANAYPARLPQG